MARTKNKHTKHHKNTQKTPRRNRHSEIINYVLFCNFFLFLYDFVNDFCKKCCVTALVWHLDSSLFGQWHKCLLLQTFTHNHMLKCIIKSCFQIFGNGILICLKNIFTPLHASTKCLNPFEMIKMRLPFRWHFCHINSNETCLGTSLQVNTCVTVPVIKI